MKPLLVVALLMCSSQGLMAQTTRIFSRHVGEFASFSQSPDPFSNVSLTVSRMANSGTPASATINYSTFSVATDFSSVTFVQIFGAIPATSFTGTTTQDLTLNLDTSTLDPTTSFSQSCTINLVTFVETCGPAPTGVINLEFRENGAQRTRVVDFNEIVTNGSTTTHIRQKSDNSTANMQGSIFGTAFSSSTATVGVNHEGSLEVIK